MSCLIPQYLFKVDNNFIIYKHVKSFRKFLPKMKKTKEITCLLMLKFWELDIVV